MESGIPSAEIGLLFNGIPMTDQKKTLKDYGVKDGDMVMMDRIRRQQRPAPAPGSGGGGFNFDFSQIQIPSNLRGFVVTNVTKNVMQFQLNSIAIALSLRF